MKKTSCGRQGNNMYGNCRLLPPAEYYNNFSFYRRRITHKGKTNISSDWSICVMRDVLKCYQLLNKYLSNRTALQ